MADKYEVSLCSRKTGVCEVPCTGLNQAKKLMRICPPDRFIKMVRVRK